MPAADPGARRLALRALLPFCFAGFLIAHAAMEFYELLYAPTALWIVAPALTLLFYGYLLFSPEVENRMAVGLAAAASIALLGTPVKVVGAGVSLGDAEALIGGLFTLVCWLVASALFCFVGAVLAKALRRAWWSPDPAVAPD